MSSPEWEGNPEMERVRQEWGRSPKAYLFPLQSLLVHQNPHQLRDGQGGVGVIELDGHLGGGGCGGQLQSIWAKDYGHFPLPLLSTPCPRALVVL